MEDILNNGQGSSNNNISTNNTATPSSLNPVTPTTVPPVNPSSVNQPVIANPGDSINSAPTAQNVPVNTGEQYEVNELHPDDLDMQWTRWKCLVCNYIYEGARPLKKCPRCGNEDPDKFEDID